MEATLTEKELIKSIDLKLDEIRSIALSFRSLVAESDSLFDDIRHTLAQERIDNDD